MITDTIALSLLATLLFLGNFRTQVKSIQSQSHITTHSQTSQSVSLRVEPHVGLMTRYVLLFDSYGFVLWGALSDERTGLSFVYAAGHYQGSLSRDLVTWES
jgi:hypothetical protein